MYSFLLAEPKKQDRLVKKDSITFLLRREIKTV